jgi:hypothetical protein
VTKYLKFFVLWKSKMRIFVFQEPYVLSRTTLEVFSQKSSDQEAHLKSGAAVTSVLPWGPCVLKTKLRFQNLLIGSQGSALLSWSAQHEWSLHERNGTWDQLRRGCSSKHLQSITQQIQYHGIGVWKFTLTPPPHPDRFTESFRWKP